MDQPGDIEQCFIHYYADFFSSLDLPRVQEAIQTIPQVMTDSMNADLVGTFHEWEVEMALKQMAPLEAPSPNGMPPFLPTLLADGGWWMVM